MSGVLMGGVGATASCGTSETCWDHARPYRCPHLHCCRPGEGRPRPHSTFHTSAPMHASRKIYAVSTAGRPHVSSSTRRPRLPPLPPLPNCLLLSPSTRTSTWSAWRRGAWRRSAPPPACRRRGPPQPPSQPAAALPRTVGKLLVLLVAVVVPLDSYATRRRAQPAAVQAAGATAGSRGRPLGPVRAPAARRCCSLWSPLPLGA